MSWAPSSPIATSTALVAIASEVIKSKVNIPWRDAERIAKAAYAAAYSQAESDILAKIAADKARGGQP